MSRTPVAVALALAALSAVPSAPAQDKPAPGSYLSPELLTTGLKLLKDKNLALNTNIDFRPHFHAVFAPKASLFELNLGARNKERDAIEEQLRRETNELLKLQLEVQKRQLDVQIEQAKLAAAQAELLGQIRDQAVVAFRYQKDRDDAVLRRLEYPVTPGNLVVVVADFSSGGTGEGVEVADEIANALREMKSRYGFNLDVLVGEVKDRVVIRSEQMALEVGRHFPKGTSYAVVWGTISPRTVGQFRPHVTCAVKVDDERAIGKNYTMDLDAQDWPTTDKERHRSLVAFACAVVPGVYASHRITRDEQPGLEAYFKALEAGGEGTRKLADDYRRELAPLTRWIDVQPRYTHLRRMTPVTKDTAYPRLVLNTRDNSLMTLVTEPGKETPQRFKDEGGEYLCYIDVTETTNRQLVAFLNDAGNKEDGGARWVEIAPGTHIAKNAETGRFEVGNMTEDAERPAINVNFIGAEAYCRWVSKELPRVDEWRAAARPAGEGKYPWGAETGDLKTRCANSLSKREPFPLHRVGAFPPDRSHIGCLDMAGNVSEWCDGTVPGSRTDRFVCGGNIGDKDPACFETTRQAAVAQTTHHPWLGFRGVVRVRIPAAK